jgi:pimeloyl-ACP methyl ester carboxylesterase
VVAAGLASAGHPRAEQAAADIDETMKRCILALYRSATDLPADWSPTGPAPRPALVLWGKDDPVGPPASGQRFAAATGARMVLLDGGHWAILERAKVAAAELASFWAAL